MKRMINNVVTDAGIFLMMPPSTQSLYFHLCTHADDDGVVDAYSIIRMTQSKEDDFAILVSKKFVTVLDSAQQLIWINHWFEHNTIRSELITPSTYRELLVSVIPGVPVKESKKDADTRRRIAARKAVRSGQTADKQRIRTVSAENPRYSIEKSSIVKSSFTPSVPAGVQGGRNAFIEGLKPETRALWDVWESTRTEITTDLEGNRSALNKLLDLEGSPEKVARLIELSGKAYEDKYCPKEYKASSPHELWNKRAGLLSWGKGKFTQQQIVRIPN